MAWTKLPLNGGYRFVGPNGEALIEVNAAGVTSNLPQEQVAPYVAQLQQSDPSVASFFNMQYASGAPQRTFAQAIEDGKRNAGSDPMGDALTAAAFAAVGGAGAGLWGPGAGGTLGGMNPGLGALEGGISGADAAAGMVPEFGTNAGYAAGMGGGGGTTGVAEMFNAPQTFGGWNSDPTMGGLTGNESNWYDGMQGASDAGGTSPYANWASQGGGVDPSSTALGGQVNSSGGGGFFDKLGNWVTSPSGLSTLGTVAGAGINYLGATQAAKAQQQGAQGQQDLLKYMYDQNRADLAPWREAGVGALGNLTNLTTPGKQLDTAMLDPGYAFRQSEGEKGINRAAAARGLWDSGRTYKALDRFNQNYATGEFGNVFNRNAALAGIGQTAVGQGVQAGQNYGQQAGESMLQGANARASGYVGGANALSGGLSSLINQYSQQAMLDKIFGRG